MAVSPDMETVQPNRSSTVASEAVSLAVSEIAYAREMVPIKRTIKSTKTAEIFTL